jgi:hypothetical protein
MENQRLRDRLEEIGELATGGLNPVNQQTESSAPSKEPEVYDLLG